MSRERKIDTYERRERHERREGHEKRGRHEKSEGATTFKTLPCLRSKRSSVYIQNARVLCDTGDLKVHTGAFRTYTRERFLSARQEETHTHTHTHKTSVITVFLAVEQRSFSPKCEHSKNHVKHAVDRPTMNVV